MANSIEQELKAMQYRAAQIESLGFELVFANDRIKAKANAIEYGYEKEDHTIVPPVPFMRMTKERYETDWENMMERLVSNYIENGVGRVSLIGQEIALAMEDDYKSTALSYAIPQEIVDGISVEWSGG